jgi:peptidoglycan/xylan/chitin deacetylase (PgdA/CDA1 family)
MISQGYQFHYPNEKSWALLLTHDIDDIEVQNRHIYLSFLYFPTNGDLKGMYHLIKGRINRRYSPYNNFKPIIEIEQQYNATSTFYFLSSPKDIFGYKYSLNENMEILGYIKDQGCEIGYHTGYHHYDDCEKIKMEKAHMEKIIGERLVGVRNHVLRFQTPRSWEILANAGFEYDSTYGYIDMIGFRNGLCHPFIPYNIDTNHPIDILEIPLNIQDWTISFIMKNNPSEAWNLIKQLLETVKKNHGVINILWHNWTFSFPTSIGTMFEKEWTRLYEKILKYATENDAWVSNCKDFINYYRKNKYMTHP